MFQPRLDGNGRKKVNVKKKKIKSGARRRKYRRTLMGGAPAVSLKNKGGSLEINVFISGWELKTQGGWRWGRPETDCVCWLGATPAEQDERKPATVVDVTNSPLHFCWILWLTLSIFHLYWCPSKSDAFFFVFCVLSPDCCHPESKMREKAFDSSPTLLTVIAPGCNNTLSDDRHHVISTLQNEVVHLQM